MVGAADPSDGDPGLEGRGVAVPEVLGPELRRCAALEVPDLALPVNLDECRARGENAAETGPPTSCRRDSDFPAFSGAITCDTA
jgi:hypothetical protein